MNRILLMLLLAAGNAFAQSSDTIDLKDLNVSFTNLQNVAYTNVTLARANLDGVIYYCDGGGGLISYTNLSPALLEQWGIPTSRIQQAAQRAAEKAERDRQYWQNYQAQQQALAAQQAKAQADELAKEQAAAAAAANQPGKPAHKGKSKSGQNNGSGQNGGSGQNNGS